MITLIVPTRNRAHTLQLVAPSYFQQEQVTEIIFVSDAGTDDTPALIERLAAAWPQIRTRFVCNRSRLGASASRNVGVQMATNDYVLFCDDDESLETGYARICFEKLVQFDAGAVSGRRIYLEPGETPGCALDRFGLGIRNTPADARPHLRVCQCSALRGRHPTAADQCDYLDAHGAPAPVPFSILPMPAGTATARSRITK